MQYASLFLLAGLTEPELATCRQIADTEAASFCKGQAIYTPESARRALALILEGHARVWQGHVVLNDLLEGDVFGAAALFGSNEEYPSTVVAETNCRVLFIPQETVVAWMKAVPAVTENYIRFLSDRIRFLNLRLSTLTAGQSDGKLWRYLLAHRNEEGAVQLIGGMTELAERLDMGRSSLYRSLDALAQAGRIRRDKKTIYILKTEE